MTADTSHSGDPEAGKPDAPADEAAHQPDPLPTPEQEIENIEDEGDPIGANFA